MDNKDFCISLIKGMGKGIFIPDILLRLCNGDSGSAIFLSQCIYWTDKMGRPFYKSYADWEKDYYLSRKTLDRARNNLAGIVQTELRKTDGAPTLWYSVNWDNLFEAIGKLTDCDPANPFVPRVQMDLSGEYKSLTETTTETNNNYIYIEPEDENFSEDTTFSGIDQNGDPEINAFIRVFEQEMGKVVVPYSRIYELIKEFIAAGLSPEEYRKAIREQKAKGYTISTMESTRTFGLNFNKAKNKKSNAYQDANPTMQTFNANWNKHTRAEKIELLEYMRQYGTLSKEREEEAIRLGLLKDE
jgi:flagellar biosynthesis chaperone FliJ